MKPELMLLAWSVLLAFAQMLVAVTGYMLQVGLPALAGNREGLQPASGWAGRAARAHRNMIENLMLFAPLVLIAAVAGKTGDMTLLGAQIFFWARLAYAFVYLAGIPWLRTGVWTVSAVGMALVFFALL